MAKIKVRHGESLEQALRRFNRMVQKEGILDEIKKRQHFVKKSEEKRQKAKELARRIYLENKNKW